MFYIFVLSLPMSALFVSLSLFHVCFMCLGLCVFFTMDFAYEMNEDDLISPLAILSSNSKKKLISAKATLHPGRPPYLSDLLQHHQPARSLRSSSSHQLSVLRHNITFAFRFSAPRVWNSLPVSIRKSQSLPTFRRHLKTFYFQSAYPIVAAHLA